MSLAERIVIAAALAWILGFAGTAAFNPDDGVVLRSDLLWTVSGLALYAGILVGVAGSVGLAMAAAFRKRR